MESETPRPIVEYRTPPQAGTDPWFRLGDGILLGVFALYAAANWYVINNAFPPWNAFLAFTIPLPLIFIVIIVLTHFLNSPPLFNRWVLLAVVFLVIVEAVLNLFVAAEVSASV